jgi:DNA polymerase III alpha subunit
MLKLKKHIQWFKRVFADDFYMELMPHNGADVNKQLADLG